MRIFFIIIIIVAFIYEVESASKYFLGESGLLCPNNNQLPAKIKSFDIHNEKKLMITSALIELNETLKGPLEMVTTLEKCNMEMTKCTGFPPINFPDVCSQFNSKFFGPNFLSRLTPKLECPVKAGNYFANNSEVDFTNMGKIPFDVGRYKLKWNIYQSKNPLKKRLVMCWGGIGKLMVSSDRGRGK